MPRTRDSESRRERSLRNFFNPFSFSLSLSQDLENTNLAFTFLKEVARRWRRRRWRNELSTVVGGNSPAASLDIRNSTCRSSAQLRSRYHANPRQATKDLGPSSDKAQRPQKLTCALYVNRKSIRRAYVFFFFFFPG